MRSGTSRPSSTTPPTAARGPPSRGAPGGGGGPGSLDGAPGGRRPWPGPMTILRATAGPGGAAEPYGPLVRALGPSLRELPADVLAARLGSAASEVIRLL